MRLYRGNAKVGLACYTKVALADNDVRDPSWQRLAVRIVLTNAEELQLQRLQQLLLLHVAGVLKWEIHTWPAAAAAASYLPWRSILTRTTVTSVCACAPKYNTVWFYGLA